MKKVLCALLCITIIFSLCSCALLENNAVFTMGVLESVNTFNPIHAKTDAEKILSDNCFEGLLRFDEKGKINLAGATAYTTDKDALTYTFKLNPTAQWHISEQTQATLETLGLTEFNPLITADDYVYGIEKFKESDSVSLACIKEAKAIDDTTLEITLTQADPDFLYKLAALPVFPCSRTFYEKLDSIYATTTGTLLTNGPYCVKEHTPAEIIIERNPDYSGNIQVQNKKVLLYTTGAEEFLKERFTDESYNVYITESKSDLIKNEPSFISTEMTWGIAFNCKSKIGSVKDLRFALFNAIDYESIPLPKIATSKATSIIPKNFTIGDTRYADFATEPLTYQVNKTHAVEIVDSLQNQYDIGAYIVTFAVPEEMENSAKRIINDWEAVFGSKISVTLSTFKLADTKKIAEEGNFDVAILPVNTTTKTASGVINAFADAPFNYRNKELTGINNSLTNIAKENFVTYRTAEETIVNENVFMPIFYSGKILYLNKNYTGIYLADGGKMLYFHAGAEK